MNKDDLKYVAPGAVVQISPEFVNPTFAGCFAIVEEKKIWGVKAYVLIPSGNNELPGKAYIRIAPELMEYVGPAIWTMENEE